MLFECSALEAFRSGCCIRDFVHEQRAKRPMVSSVSLYKMFLDDTKPREIAVRAKGLYYMKVAWCQLMGLDPD